MAEKDSAKKIKVPCDETFEVWEKDKDLATQLNHILRRLHCSTAGFIGAGIISGDGFIIASDLPQNVEEQRIAALAATMLALGERTTSEFEHGSVRRMLVEGDRGYMVVMSAGSKAALSAVAQNDAKLGLVLFQMERAAQAIDKILG